MFHAKYDDGIDKHSGHYRRNAGERVDQEPNNARKHSASELRKIDAGSNAARYAYDAREQ